jgi:hypoxanthine phosphoribosyltransferase
MNKPELKRVFSREQIDDQVKILARRISQDYGNRDLVLIGVLNGVFIFFADLTRYITIPIHLDFVRVASYGSDCRSSGQIVMTKDIEIDIKNKDALIVEDIADSGLTLKWLTDYIWSKGAHSVKTCVLINKLERRNLTVPLEYVGFDVDEGFLVGYGLDYAGQYRNLPEIYHLVMP